MPILTRAHIGIDWTNRIKDDVKNTDCELQNIALSSWNKYKKTDEIENLTLSLKPN